jgi:hypothetical protein
MALTHVATYTSESTMISGVTTDEGGCILVAYTTTIGSTTPVSGGGLTWTEVVNTLAEDGVTNIKVTMAYAASPLTDQTLSFGSGAAWLDIFSGAAAYPGFDQLNIASGGHTDDNEGIPDTTTPAIPITPSQSNTLGVSCMFSSQGLAMTPLTGSSSGTTYQALSAWSVLATYTNAVLPEGETTNLGVGIASPDMTNGSWILAANISTGAVTGGQLWPVGL